MSKNQNVKIPFHPIIIPLFCVLFTFLVGGIVSGLNWTRLNRPQWKYPTIGITAAAFAVFMLLYNFIPLSWNSFIVYISYGSSAIAGLILYFVQKPYYDKWKQGKL